MIHFIILHGWLNFLQGLLLGVQIVCTRRARKRLAQANHLLQRANELQKIHWIVNLPCGYQPVNMQLQPLATDGRIGDSNDASEQALS